MNFYTLCSAFLYSAAFASWPPTPDSQSHESGDLETKLKECRFELKACTGEYESCLSENLVLRMRLGRAEDNLTECQEQNIKLGHELERCRRHKKSLKKDADRFEKALTRTRHDLKQLRSVVNQIDDSHVTTIEKVREIIESYTRGETLVPFGFYQGDMASIPKVGGSVSLGQMQSFTEPLPQKGERLSLTYPATDSSSHSTKRDKQVKKATPRKTPGLPSLFSKGRSSPDEKGKDKEKDKDKDKHKDRK